MEELRVIFFYMLSIILVISSVGVLLTQRASYYLGNSLLAALSVGGLYFMLNAEFNAVIYILISILLITFLYGIVLFLPKLQKNSNKFVCLKLLFGFVSIFLFLGLMLIALQNHYMEQYAGVIVVLEPLNNMLSNVYTVAENSILNYCPVFVSISVCSLVLIITLGGIFCKKNSSERRGDD